MFIVLGATGHIGHAVVTILLERGQAVTAVVHDAGKAAGLRDAGAAVQEVDVRDSDALRPVFAAGRRAFLLNPPADVAGHTDREEHRTAKGIAAALDGSGLEKVVLASAYGAQLGEAIGDLSVLYDFEQLVKASGIPAAINRGAYYFTNFEPLVEPARRGKLTTMIPGELRLPMVAPEDLGRAAADRLMSPLDDVGLCYVEGPARYTFAEVAAAFAAALGRPVELAVTPRDQWEETYRAQGFSAAAAHAFTRMTAVSVDGGFELSDDPIRGLVTLDAYIRELVARG